MSYGTINICEMHMHAAAFPSLFPTSELVNDRGIKQVREGGEEDETCHSAQMLLQSESSPCLGFSPFPAAGSVSGLIKRTAGKVEFKVTQSHSLLLCHHLCAGTHFCSTPTTTHELTIGVPLGRCAYMQEILCTCIFTPSMFSSVQTMVYLLGLFGLGRRLTIELERRSNNWSETVQKPPAVMNCEKNDLIINLNK